MSRGDIAFGGRDRGLDKVGLNGSRHLGRQFANLFGKHVRFNESNQTLSSAFAMSHDYTTE